MSTRCDPKLLELFEQELRALDARFTETSARRRRVPPRVSRELDQRIVQFAAEERTQGSTPEQMLVELKAALANAAPDVPTAQRNVLVAALTGRAIDAFYARQKSSKTS
ncbi:MAG TPA: hypothetical protein VJ867_15890 [Gemmatimonadaceae bacterium]|nr:hypothetical protein [Gemmatimonadaceae bacterium]